MEMDEHVPVCFTLIFQLMAWRFIRDMRSINVFYECCRQDMQIVTTNFRFLSVENVVCFQAVLTFSPADFIKTHILYVWLTFTKHYLYQSDLREI